jgi:hypothetical protein
VELCRGPRGEWAAGASADARRQAGTLLFLNAQIGNRIVLFHGQREANISEIILPQSCRGVSRPVLEKKFTGLNGFWMIPPICNVYRKKYLASLQAIRRVHDKKVMSHAALGSDLRSQKS